MSNSDETPFPTRQDILTFLRDGGEPVAVKEIAQAFGLRRPDQPALRAMLREMVETGALERDGKRGYRPGRGLPPVAVIEVIGTDADGELLARPANWPQDLPPPPIYLSPDRRSGPAPGRGDRVLARLTAADDGSFEARAIRVLGGAPKLVLGLYQKDQKGGRLQPTDRRAKSDYLVRAEDALDARPGELVLAEIKPRQSRLGLREVRIRERRGDLGDTGNLSLIAALEHDLPMVFSPEALAQAAEAGPAGHDSPGEERRDLREIPLVTIDGRDARDFDDAVWAAPLDRVEASDGSAGGWRIIVAIADVAHYVRPGSALDRDAFERGNSVYFPDRVIPMLPEALSNGWCSLVPGEDRPCLAFDMRIDPAGQLAEYKIERALMRSSARLTYEQVQAARDGRPDETTAPLLDSVITPLYGVFHALAEARDKRGTLDLDLPERQIELDSAGRVAAVRARERLDSHRLIEEMMIAANVAAARALEARGAPCVYRIHDEPDPQKLEALRDVLDGVGLKLARGQVIRPALFRQILEQVRGEDYAPMVNDLVLRSQSQARYSVENHGHFGLALPRYAHFTSPIRRYADLLVHRALIDAYRLGPGGLAGAPGTSEGTADQTALQGAALERAADHISGTERKAVAAERDSNDRYVAAFLQTRTGQDFPGRISGVTRFGLFATLDDLGADGLIPVSRLPDDRYDHLAAEHALVGRRWGRVYRLGTRVTVRLKEANPVTGGMLFDLLEAEADGLPEPRRQGDRAGTGRPGGGGGRSGKSPSRRKGGPKSGRKGKRRRS